MNPEMNLLIHQLQANIENIIIAEYREDYAILHEVKSLSINGNCIQLNLLKDGESR